VVARLVTAVLLTAPMSALAADKPSEEGRIVLRDCPGECTGKHLFAYPGKTCRKILWCDVDPGKAESAALRVCIRNNPYYVPAKRYYTGALDVPGFEPRDLIARVNGEEVFRSPIGVAAVEGWHEYPIPVKSLKRGRNVIEITQAENGAPRLFYVATNKGSQGHSFESRNKGRNFEPLPDELLIQVALRVDAETMAQSSRRRRFTAARAPRAPRLTGDLSDPAWRGAARLDGFVTRNGLPSEEAPTEAFLLCDKTHLYVGFLCHEPRAAELVANCSVAGGPVWNDDCVELHLDPANGATAMYKWIVNSRGVVWDGFTGPAGLDEGYNSGAGAKGSVGPDRWTVEIKVPLTALPCPPQPGEVWGVNFCRARKAGNREVELSSWAPAAGDFTDPARLGEAAFEPAAAPLTVRLLSRGARSVESKRRALNVFRVEACNTGAAAATVRLEVRTDDELCAHEEVVAASATTILDLAYEASGDRASLSYRVLVDGQPVHASQLDALSGPDTSRARVWQVPDPLFEEVLSAAGAEAPRTCALMWAHPIVRVPMLRDTAKCLATRYVLDEMCQEFVRHGVLVVGSPAAARQRQMPSVCYPSMAPRGAHWQLDPKSIEYALDTAGKRLEGAGGVAWGVFGGDELNQTALHDGAKLMANPPADYPFIREANESVKREFGGGRWGIPEGSHDSNPHRWIAFRRWCNARLRDRNARLRELVKQRRADLRMVSFDPQGCLQSLEWSGQVSQFDIFTHQVVPRGSDTSARTGFFTKLMVDLTGKDVWPCVHVEHYKVARTPAEAVEVLSQVVRNGGTGFHLFLTDISNSNKRVGDTRLCFFGSPRRYHTIMNVVDLVRTMPRPLYPANVRTAVLFNDDTIASHPYRSESEHSRRTEACYMALGPVARSWFTFVDCAQLLTAKDLRGRFDTIHLPAARYQRPEVVDVLRRFVRQGGTLVCADASAFQTDTLGNDTASSRAELFGVDVGEALAARKLVPKIAQFSGVLPLKSRALTLIPRTPAVQVLATYEQGAAAVTLNPFGQGRAILFGSDPFRENAIGDPAWGKFYTRWARWLGAPTDLDIWRFRFPDRVICREPQETGLCLTNNHVVWREESPSFAQNSGLNGSCRYSVLPDALPGAETAPADMPFAKGRLTDRRRSILAAKKEAAPYSDYELPTSRWTESWSTPDPVSLTFDLTRPWTPLRVKLWFCDTLPDLTVEGSADARTWRPLGRAKGLPAGDDVHDLNIPLQGEPGRYVRINFGQRPERRKMTLVEVEVWGEEPRH